MEWNRGPVIGRGSTATVYLATAVPSGELFAVKSTHLSSSTFLRREQSFLSKLSNPYIVKYLGSDIRHENGNPMYNLCMEYVSGGTIFDAIQRHGGKLEESAIRLYTNQILQGLNYLHGNGLVHCDIKSQNILLGKDGPKIADLGCAKSVGKVVGNGDIFAKSAFSGTPAFMAPEVARGEEQGFAADVWAIGCTMIEMATGNHPWSEINDPVTALYKIGFSDEVPECPNWLSYKAKDFLSKCLKREPKERWTVQELLEHPFLNEVECKISSSPNSVLDQLGFWDSYEVRENHINISFEGSLNSQAERIKTLIGNSSSVSEEVPNWSNGDEDWVTVRSNFNEEEQIMEFLADETLNGTELATDSSEISDFDGDLLFYYPVENVSAMIRFQRESLTESTSLEYDSVLESFNFGSENEKKISIQSQMCYIFML